MLISTYQPNGFSDFYCTLLAHTCVLRAIKLQYLIQNPFTATFG